MTSVSISISISQRLQQLVDAYHRSVTAVLGELNAVLPIVIDDIWRFLEILRWISPVPIEQRMVLVEVKYWLEIEERENHVECIDVAWDGDRMKIVLRHENFLATTLFFSKSCRVTVDRSFELDYYCQQTLSALLTILRNLDIIMQGVEKKLNSRLEHASRLVSKFFELMQQVGGICRTVEAIKSVSRIEALMKELEEQPRS